jgi:hypothetical protein
MFKYFAKFPVFPAYHGASQKRLRNSHVRGCILEQVYGRPAAGYNTSGTPLECQTVPAAPA